MELKLTAYEEAQIHFGQLERASYEVGILEAVPFDLRDDGRWGAEYREATTRLGRLWRLVENTGAVATLANPPRHATAAEALAGSDRAIGVLA